MCEGDLTRHCKVADIVNDGHWKWPENWQTRFPILFQHPTVNLQPEMHDKIRWKTSNGKLIHFAVSDVWLDIREECEEVPWVKLVWFSQNIPRHAFILWLALKNKLQTHDIIGRWSDVSNLRCSLCKSTQDSHSHLFFECQFSRKIWDNLKSVTKIGSNEFSWALVVNYMCSLPGTNSVWSIINRLTLGAAVYYIWQERNLRVHESRSRSADEVLNLIKETVRLRLMGVKVAKTAATLLHLLSVNWVWWSLRTKIFALIGFFERDSFFGDENDYTHIAKSLLSLTLTVIKLVSYFVMGGIGLGWACVQEEVSTGWTLGWGGAVGSICFYWAGHCLGWDGVIRGRWLVNPSSSSGRHLVACFFLIIWSVGTLAFFFPSLQCRWLVRGL
ncbi:putative reverse transcriptase zinc-binding domain-containing protein [Helianthus anomalus]